MNNIKNFKKVVLQVFVVAIAFVLGFAGYNLLSGNGSGGSSVNGSVVNGSATVVKAAIAADGDSTGDTEDKGEVQKGDIIDYWLEATYVGFGDDRSGLVTFTDVLPEHMELVTGNQTVAGQEKDCTPTVTNTSGVTWADPTNPYTYDSSTRTFKAQVANIPASQGADTGNVVSIHIYAKIVDDAESLGVKNVYYTNYVTITHAAASSISNKVQFHSGNISEETYKVKYKFADGSPVPNGVTAPTDDAYYGKGSAIAVQPDMKAQGYKFSGWSLVTGGLADTQYIYDKDKHSFTLNEGTDGITEVTFEGSWTENNKVELTYAWQGKFDTIDSADSDDDTPSIDLPATSKVDEEAAIQFPTYPVTEAERSAAGYDATKDSYTDIYKQYKFLGWKVTLNYSDKTSEVQALTSAETTAKEFTPKPSAGKTLSGITLTGYWTKTTFNVTFEFTSDDASLTDWPDGTTKPTLGAIKWGSNFTLPGMTPNGYRFVGWNTEPDLGSGNNANNGGKQFVMPSNNVTATATFTKTYKVTMTSGTASTSVVAEADEIQAEAGEVVTIKPLQDLEDIRFNEWSTTVKTDANNWVQKDDGTATFVMPASDVDVTGKYITEVDFLVVNGKWRDGTTGYKMKEVDVTQQSDGSWAGTLAQADVPTGMNPDSSHKDTGKWGDGTTAAQNPNNYVGTGKITATAAGKANQLTLFTYYFNDVLDDITVTYSVKTGQSNFGTVTLNKDGETAKQTVSETFDPLGNNSTPVGVTAKANARYKFVNWTKDTDTDAFSLDAKFVPSKIINTGGTTEFYEKADYIANFEPNSYTVKFNGNGATSGTMDDLSLTVGTRSALTANAFVKDGFKFGGWTANADYTGDYYADEEDVLNLATDDGAVVNLYAKWVENKGEVVPVDPADPTAGSLTGYANNIRIPLSQAEQLAGKTDSSILTTLTSLSAAYFTFTKADSRTELVDVASVKSNNIKAAVGTYDATLKSAVKSGITASVKFTVVVYNETSGDTDADPTIKIAANDFTVSVDEVKAGKLNDGNDAGAKAELIRLSNAYAWNALTRDEIEVSSVTSTIAVDAAGAGVKGVYDVTFAAQSADGAKKAEVTVAATVTDYADEKADMRITAHDFAVATSNVANMSDADFVEAANARATSTVDGSALGVSIDRTTEAKTNVKAARGKYVMTFYTESAAGLKDGPEVTVEVLVTDKIIDDGDSNHVIYANDFSVGANYVAQLDDAKVMRLANAGAYDKATGADLALSVDYHVVEAKRGTYFPVAFSTNKANLNVACVVTDESTEPGGDDATYDLSANNFTISVDEATDILAMSEANKNKELIDRAFARAVLIETGEYVDFTTIDSSRLQAKDGKYNITFAVDADHSITVVCTVGGTIEPSGPDASSRLGISASDFKIGLEQATDLKIDRPEGNDALIELASARAWKIADNSSVQISEIVNNIELQRGSYDMTFKAVLYDYADDGTATEVDTKEVTVLATIQDKQVDPNPDPSPDPDPDKPTPKPDPDDPDFVNVEAFANDFVVSVKDVNDNNLGDGNVALDKLIELGNVSARTITEHVAVDIVSAVSTIQPAKGTYFVTYTSDKVDGKSVDITSKVRVTDEGEGGGESGGGDDAKSAERILANNFALSKAEADAIARGGVYTDSKIDRAYAAAALNAGQEELIRLSNAFAYRVADGYQLDITRVDFDYTGELGASTATFATEKGTSVSVVATVTSESAENAENGERIVANDIEYTYDEAVEMLAKANDEIATQLKDDAEAQAYSTVDGAHVDVVQATWNIEAKTGVYDVTFETKKGTSVTVKATVGDAPVSASWLGNTGDNLFKAVIIFIALAAGAAACVAFARRRNR